MRCTRFRVRVNVVNNRSYSSSFLIILKHPTTKSATRMRWAKYVIVKEVLLVMKH